MTDLVQKLVALISEAPHYFAPQHDFDGKKAEWFNAQRAALSEAKAGGWVLPYDSVPQPDQTVLVWSCQTWETAPSLKIDTWSMQREAPLSFSTATIETGYGWDEHENFESVIAWQPLPAPPAQKEPT